jgi:peptidoglycan hydrolase FlgJ
MAVTLPSDLVLDVMRNADPARSRELLTRLSRGSEADAADDSFAAALKDAGSMDASGFVAAASTGGVSLPLMPGESPDAKVKAYSSLEQFLLQNMVETMLPSPDSGVFGDQVSGGVWRSMTADALSKAVADSGGIGLAQVLSSRESGVERAAQWPYFGTSQIQDFVSPGTAIGES